MSRDYATGPWHRWNSGMPDLDILASNSFTVRTKMRHKSKNTGSVLFTTEVTEQCLVHSRYSIYSYIYTQLNPPVSQFHIKEVQSLLRIVSRVNNVPLA